jgi:cytochrome c peroxidase
MKLKIIAATLVGASILYSCTKSIDIASTTSIAPKLPVTAYAYSKAILPFGNGYVSTMAIQRPDFMGKGVFGNVPVGNGNEPAFNSVTDHGATLGRVLFYDTKLSLNNTVSCGTCHHQSKAFADGLATSVGFENRRTVRNSMAFCNTILTNNLFWDSRSQNLNDLALRPVTNHIEMGMDDMNRLVKKLSTTDYYPQLFANAFSGSQEISQEKISAAISMFVASITTHDSRFDRAIRNTTNTPDPNSGLFVAPQFNLAALDLDLSKFSVIEQQGHELFMANCATCHSGANFAADDTPNGEYGSSNGGESRKGATNIGLDLIDTDGGVDNQGTFRIPSLRNVALTAPYMHDGRFTSLDAVLDHYSHGVKPNKNLDQKLKDQTGNVRHMNFTETQKLAIITFLGTLTDNTMTTSPMYSNPFVQ